MPVSLWGSDINPMILPILYHNCSIDAIMKSHTGAHMDSQQLVRKQALSLSQLSSHVQY